MRVRDGARDVWDVLGVFVWIVCVCAVRVRTLWMLTDEAIARAFRDCR